MFLAWQQKSWWIRIIAITLTIAFIHQDLIWAQEGAPVWSNKASGNWALPSKGAASNSPNIDIPKDVAITKEVFRGNNGDNKTIINIQDAHSSLGAQESISQILDSLVTNYDLKLVAIEGSSGYIDTSVLKTFPDEVIRNSTARSLMAEGKMSAGEFYSVTSNKKIALYGIENSELYRENIEEFRSVYEASRKIAKDVTNLANVLNKIKDRVYSPELKELESNSVLRKDGSVSFTERWNYVDALAGKFGITYDSYPNLKKLVESMRIEKSLSFDLANRERDILIDAISKVASKADLERLVLKSLSFKQGKIGQGEYYLLIQELAKVYSVDPAPYKNLIRFTDYINLYESIDLIEIFEEAKVLEDAIKEKLYTDPDQRKLHNILKCVNYIKDIFELKLTNAEFEYLENNVKDCSAEAIGTFINFHGETPDYDLDNIFKNIPVAISFYKTAEKRNNAILENTISRMNKEGQSVAALITGGYHTKGMSELLKAKETSYLVILPKLDASKGERPYVAILTNKNENNSEELRLFAFIKEIISTNLKEAKASGKNVHNIAQLWIENYRANYEELSKRGLTSPSLRGREAAEAISQNGSASSPETKTQVPRNDGDKTIAIATKFPNNSISPDDFAKEVIREADALEKTNPAAKPYALETQAIHTRVAALEEGVMITRLSRDAELIRAALRFNEVFDEQFAKQCSRLGVKNVEASGIDKEKIRRAVRKAILAKQESEPIKKVADKQEQALPAVTVVASAKPVESAPMEEVSAAKPSLLRRIRILFTKIFLAGIFVLVCANPVALANIPFSDRISSAMKDANREAPDAQPLPAPIEFRGPQGAPQIIMPEPTVPAEIEKPASIWQRLRIYIISLFGAGVLMTVPFHRKPKTESYIEKAATAGIDEGLSRIKDIFAEFDKGELTKAIRLDSGLAGSQPWLIETAQGKFILTKSTLRNTPQTIKREYSLLKLPKEKGFTLSPEMFISKDRRPFVQSGNDFYKLYEFKTGKQAEWWKVSGSKLVNAAKVQAAYHNAVNGAIFDMKNIDNAGSAYPLADILNLNEIRGWFHKARDALPERFPENHRYHLALNELLPLLGAGGYLDEELKKIENGAASQGYKNLPMRVIHGDYCPNNILFTGDEVSAVIDFDYARLAPRIADLTAHGIINIGWGMDKADLSELIKYLQAYQAASDDKLTLEELHAMPQAFRAQFLQEISMVIHMLYQDLPDRPAESIIRILNENLFKLRALDVSIERGDWQSVTDTLFSKKRKPEWVTGELNAKIDPGILAKMKPFEEPHYIISDLHGVPVERLQEVLRHMRFIGDDGSVIPGKKTLVIKGDIIDRGPASLELLRYILGLQTEAQTKGCRVVMLLGNHEGMIYAGIKLNDNDSLIDWLGNRAQSADEAAMELYSEHKALNLDAEEVQNRVRQNPEWMELYETVRSAIESGAIQACYAKNGVLFVHANLRPKFVAGRSADEVAAELNNDLKEGRMKEGTNLFNALWDRFFPGQKSVGSLLMVSHVPTDGNIAISESKDVVNDDIGFSEVYGSNTGYLEINGDKIFTHKIERSDNEVNSSKRNAYVAYINEKLSRIKKLITDHAYLFSNNLSVEEGCAMARFELALVIKNANGIKNEDLITSIEHQKLKDIMKRLRDMLEAKLKEEESGAGYVRSEDVDANAIANLLMAEGLNSADLLDVISSTTMTPSLVSPFHLESAIFTDKAVQDTIKKQFGEGTLTGKLIRGDEAIKLLNRVAGIMSGPGAIGGFGGPRGGKLLSILLLAAFGGLLYTALTGGQINSGILAQILFSMPILFSMVHINVGRKGFTAWLRFAPAEGAAIDEVREQSHEVARLIFAHVYPNEQDFGDFIKEFENDNDVPAGPREKFLTISQLSNSLLPYLFKIIDAYNLLKIHTASSLSESGKSISHFYMYNPSDIGRKATTRVMVAADGQPQVLNENISIVSEILSDALGRDVNLHAAWVTHHNKNKTALVYLDVSVMTLDGSEKMLTDDEIELVYKKLPNNMKGVTKSDLRLKPKKIMRQLLGYEAAEAGEKALAGIATRGARVAEGYAYILPKIDSSIFGEKICLPWDSKRLSELKISASIYDLERALEAVVDKHTRSRVTNILTAGITYVIDKIGQRHKKEAMHRLWILVKGIVDKTIEDGRDARKIRFLLDENINKEIKIYEDIETSESQYIADELRSLGEEIKAEFLKNRERVEPSQVQKEIVRLKEKFNQMDKMFRASLAEMAMSESDINKFGGTLENIAFTAERLIAEENYSAPAALLKIVRQTEPILKGDGRILMSLREALNHVLIGVGLLEVRDGLNGFLKNENIAMEKQNLANIVNQIDARHRKLILARRPSPYSRIFLKKLREKADKKIEEGRTATEVTAELMSEVLSESSDRIKAEIRATADEIMEELNAIRLLDDTNEFVRGEAPLVIVAESLDLYRTLRLFRESPQICAIATGGEDPTTHAVIVAGTRVPVITGVSKQGKGNVTDIIHNGDKIIISEEGSIMYANPDLETEEAMDIRRAEEELIFRSGLAHIDEPVRTTDGATINFSMDITDPENFRKALNFGFKEIGLMRSELLYQENRALPKEKDLSKLFTEIASAVEGAVTIRMFDMQPDKKPRYLAVSKSRGTAYLLSDEGRQTIAKPLARAILRAYYETKTRTGLKKNIRVLFPMVEDETEAIAIRELIREIDAEVRAELKIPGSVPPDIKIGGMYESQKAVQNAEAIAKHLDFMAVGTSDLINDIRTGGLARRGVFDEGTNDIPARFFQLALSVLDVMRRENKEICFDGAWAGYLKTVLALMDMTKGGGYTASVSVDPKRIVRLKEILRYSDVSKVRENTEHLLKEGTEAELNRVLDGMEDDFTRRAVVGAFEDTLKDRLHRQDRFPRRHPPKGGVRTEVTAAILSIVVAVASALVAFKYSLGVIVTGGIGMFAMPITIYATLFLREYVREKIPEMKQSARRRKFKLAQWNMLKVPRLIKDGRHVEAIIEFEKAVGLYRELCGGELLKLRAEDKKRLKKAAESISGVIDEIGKNGNFEECALLINTDKILPNTIFIMEEALKHTNEDIRGIIHDVIAKRIISDVVSEKLAIEIRADEPILKAGDVVLDTRYNRVLSFEKIEEDYNAENKWKLPSKRYARFIESGAIMRLELGIFLAQADAGRYVKLTEAKVGPQRVDELVSSLEKAANRIELERILRAGDRATRKATGKMVASDLAASIPYIKNDKAKAFAQNVLIRLNRPERIKAALRNSLRTLRGTKTGALLAAFIPTLSGGIFAAEPGNKFTGIKSEKLWKAEDWETLAERMGLYESGLTGVAKGQANQATVLSAILNLNNENIKYPLTEEQEAVLSDELSKGNPAAQKALYWVAYNYVSAWAEDNARVFSVDGSWDLDEDDILAAAGRAIQKISESFDSSHGRLTKYLNLCLDHARTDCINAVNDKAEKERKIARTIPAHTPPIAEHDISWLVTDPNINIAWLKEVLSAVFAEARKRDIDASLDHGENYRSSEEESAKISETAARMSRASETNVDIYFRHLLGRRDERKFEQIGRFGIGTEKKRVTGTAVKDRFLKAQGVVHDYGDRIEVVIRGGPDESALRQLLNLIRIRRISGNSVSRLVKAIDEVGRGPKPRKVAATIARIAGIPLRTYYRLMKDPAVQSELEKVSMHSFLLRAGEALRREGHEYLTETMLAKRCGVSRRTVSLHLKYPDIASFFRAGMTGKIVGIVEEAGRLAKRFRKPLLLLIIGASLLFSSGSVAALAGFGLAMTYFGDSNVRPEDQFRSDLANHVGELKNQFSESEDINRSIETIDEYWANINAKFRGNWGELNALKAVKNRCSEYADNIIALLYQGRFSEAAKQLDAIDGIVRRFGQVIDNGLFRSYEAELDLGRMGCPIDSFVMKGKGSEELGRMAEETSRMKKGAKRPDTITTEGGIKGKGIKTQIEFKGALWASVPDIYDIRDVEFRIGSLPNAREFSMIDYMMGEPRPDTYCLLVRYNDAVIGYAVYDQHNTRDAKLVNILHLAVDPDYQGRGVAKAIIDRLKRYAQMVKYDELRQFIFEDDKTARKLLEKKEFEAQGPVGEELPEAEVLKMVYAPKKLFNDRGIFGAGMAPAFLFIGSAGFMPKLAISAALLIIALKAIKPIRAKFSRYMRGRYAPNNRLTVTAVALIALGYWLRYAYGYTGDAGALLTPWAISAPDAAYPAILALGLVALRNALPSLRLSRKLIALIPLSGCVAMKVFLSAMANSGYCPNLWAVIGGTVFSSYDIVAYFVGAAIVYMVYPKEKSSTTRLKPLLLPLLIASTLFVSMGASWPEYGGPGWLTDIGTLIGMAGLGALAMVKSRGPSVQGGEGLQASDKQNIDAVVSALMAGMAEGGNYTKVHDEFERGFAAIMSRVIAEGRTASLRDLIDHTMNLLIKKFTASPVRNSESELFYGLFASGLTSLSRYENSPEIKAILLEKSEEYNLRLIDFFRRINRLDKAASKDGPYEALRFIYLVQGRHEDMVKLAYEALPLIFSNADLGRSWLTELGFSHYMTGDWMKARILLEFIVKNGGATYFDDIFAGSELLRLYNRQYFFSEEKMADRINEVSENTLKRVEALHDNKTIDDQTRADRQRDVEQEVAIALLLADDKESLKNAFTLLGDMIPEHPDDTYIKNLYCIAVNKLAASVAEEDPEKSAHLLKGLRTAVDHLIFFVSSSVPMSLEEQEFEREAFRVAIDCTSGNFSEDLEKRCASVVERSSGRTLLNALAYQINILSKLGKPAEAGIAAGRFFKELDAHKSEFITRDMVFEVFLSLTAQQRKVIMDIAEKAICDVSDWDSVPDSAFNGMIDFVLRFKEDFNHAALLKISTAILDAGMRPQMQSKLKIVFAAINKKDGDFARRTLRFYISRHRGTPMEAILNDILRKTLVADRDADREMDRIFTISSFCGKGGSEIHDLIIYEYNDLLNSYFTEKDDDPVATLKLQDRSNERLHKINPHCGFAPQVYDAIFQITLRHNDVVLQEMKELIRFEKKVDAMFDHISSNYEAQPPRLKGQKSSKALDYVTRVLKILDGATDPRAIAATDRIYFTLARIACKAGMYRRAVKYFGRISWLRDFSKGGKPFNMTPDNLNILPGFASALLRSGEDGSSEKATALLNAWGQTLILMMQRARESGSDETISTVAAKVLHSMSMITDIYSTYCASTYIPALHSALRQSVDSYATLVAEKGVTNERMVMSLWAYGLGDNENFKKIAQSLLLYAKPYLDTQKREVRLTYIFTLLNLAYIYGRENRIDEMKAVQRATEDFVNMVPQEERERNLSTADMAMKIFGGRAEEAIDGLERYFSEAIANRAFEDAFYLQLLGAIAFDMQGKPRDAKECLRRAVIAEALEYAKNKPEDSRRAEESSKFSYPFIIRFLPAEWSQKIIVMLTDLLLDESGEALSPEAAHIVCNTLSIFAEGDVSSRMLAYFEKISKGELKVEKKDDVARALEITRFILEADRSGRTRAYVALIGMCRSDKINKEARKKLQELADKAAKRFSDEDYLSVTEYLYKNCNYESALYMIELRKKNAASSLEIEEKVRKAVKLHDRLAAQYKERDFDGAIVTANELLEINADDKIAGVKKANILIFIDAKNALLQGERGPIEAKLFSVRSLTEDDVVRRAATDIAKLLALVDDAKAKLSEREYIRAGEILQRALVIVPLGISITRDSPLIKPLYEEAAELEKDVERHVAAIRQVKSISEMRIEAEALLSYPEDATRNKAYEAILSRAIKEFNNRQAIGPDTEQSERRYKYVLDIARLVYEFRERHPDISYLKKAQSIISHAMAGYWLPQLKDDYFMIAALAKAEDERYAADKRNLRGDVMFEFSGFKVTENGIMIADFNYLRLPDVKVDNRDIAKYALPGDTFKLSAKEVKGKPEKDVNEVLLKVISVSGNMVIFELPVVKTGQEEFVERLRQDFEGGGTITRVRNNAWTNQSAMLKKVCDSLMASSKDELNESGDITRATAGFDISDRLLGILLDIPDKEYLKKFSEGEKESKRWVDEIEKGLPYTLDPAQRETMVSGLNYNSIPVTFIQGPGGTGKTTITARLVKALAEKGVAVTIACQTNDALDTVILEVIDTDTFIVRVGSNEGAVDPKLMDIYGKRGELLDAILSKKKIHLVGTTINGFDGDMEVRKRPRIRKSACLVVDEAGRATVAELLYAAAMLETAGIKKVFVLGDPAQLPPHPITQEVIEEAMKYLKGTRSIDALGEKRIIQDPATGRSQVFAPSALKKFRKSLFEQALDIFDTKELNATRPDYHFLKVQRRSGYLIVRLDSYKEFYKEELVPGREESGVIIEDDYKGKYRESKERDEKDTVNMGEMNRSISWLNWLINHEKLMPSRSKEIAILSTYSAQVEHIKRAVMDFAKLHRYLRSIEKRERNGVVPDEIRNILTRSPYIKFRITDFYNGGGVSNYLRKCEAFFNDPTPQNARAIREDLRLGESFVEEKDLTDGVFAVKTVDSAIGGEWNAIIYSWVRANPNGNVGFVASSEDGKPRRNVAVARARKYAIHVWDRNTFRKSKHHEIRQWTEHNIRVFQEAIDLHGKVLLTQDGRVDVPAKYEAARQKTLWQDAGYRSGQSFVSPKSSVTIKSFLPLLITAGIVSGLGMNWPVYDGPSAAATISAILAGCGPKPLALLGFGAGAFAMARIWKGNSGKKRARELSAYNEQRTQRIRDRAWQAREKVERAAIAVRRLQHSSVTDVVELLYKDTDHKIVALRDRIKKLWNEATNVSINYHRLPTMDEAVRWLEELYSIRRETKILSSRYSKYLAHAIKIHMTREAIETLKASSDRLKQAIVILERSIKFAKGKPGVKKGKPVDTVMLVKDIYTRVIRDVGLARSGLITIDLPDEPLRVTGDKLELLNMLSSVVENAVKSAMDSESENARVVIRLRQTGRYAEITVEDNGSGINNELMRARLVSYRGNMNRRLAFQDLDTSTSGPGGGVGTTDAWYVALDNNGEIDVATSTEGVKKGTTVTIRLPLHGKRLPDITKDRGFIIGIPENISKAQEEDIRQAVGDKAEIIRAKDAEVLAGVLQDRGLRRKGIFIDNEALKNKITSEDIVAAMLATTYDGIVSVSDIDSQTRMLIAELIEELLPAIKSMGGAEIFAAIQDRLRADPGFGRRMDSFRDIVRRHAKALSASTLYNDPAIMKTALPVTKKASVILTEEDLLSNPAFANDIEDVLKADSNVSFLYGKDMNEERARSFLAKSELGPELASKINLVSKIRPDGTMKRLEEIESEIGARMPSGFSLDNAAIAISSSELRQMGGGAARMKVLELKEININGRNVLLSMNTGRVAYRIALMGQAPEKSMSLDKELPGLYYDSKINRYTYLPPVIPLNISLEAETFRNAMLLLSSAA